MSSGKEKLPRKRKISNTKMYNIFVGVYVTVAVKDLLGIGNNSKDVKFANLMVGGILLEECDSFIYLGSADGINAAIPKNQVVGIFVDVDEIMDPEESIPPGTIKQ